MLSLLSLGLLLFAEKLVFSKHSAAFLEFRALPDPGQGPREVSNYWLPRNFIVL
jgi:hypothetical protein